MRRTVAAAIGTATLVVAATGCSGDSSTGRDGGSRTPDAGTVTATLDTSSGAPTETGHTPTMSSRPGQVQVADTIASGLAVPWGIAFLPDGKALVTQRDAGTISLVSPGSVRQVGKIPETSPTSEGGLLGIAVSPDFSRDHRVFVYVTTSVDNRVLSMRFDGSSITVVRPILTGIPRGDIHDGGRLAFGPDGFLYVATGETGNGALAQDRSSLGGKILRITTAGQPAPGNPFPGSPVWTLGHRNVEGLAFDDRGRLWASEFGYDTWDELNLIQKGRNYGWPAAEGDANLSGFTDPYVQWRPDDASPSGLAFADGRLWVAALHGERLWEVPVRSDGGVGTPVAHFVGTYGRLRAIAVAPDGSLWVGTSNRDGRGDPAPRDDRILRVTLP